MAEESKAVTAGDKVAGETLHLEDALVGLIKQFALFAEESQIDFVRDHFTEINNTAANIVLLY